MNNYIALLRGINVGGHRVKMDVLRAHVSALGHSDVWTFIASGNVGFSTDRDDPEALARAIEGRLARELGYEVATFLRTPDELAAVVGIAPDLPDGWDPRTASHYVLFLDAPAPASLLSKLAQLESDTDRFLAEFREIHWLTRGRMSESPLFAGGIGKATNGVRTTTRNMTSLKKLLAKSASHGSSSRSS